jgi:hypothetical protein
VGEKSNSPRGADRGFFTYAAATAAAGLAGAAHAEIRHVDTPIDYFNNKDTGESLNFDQSDGREADMAHLDQGNSHVLKEGVAARPIFYIDGPNNDPANLAFGTLIGPGTGTYVQTPNVGDGATLLSFDDNGVKDAGNFSVNSAAPEYLGVHFTLTEGGPDYYGWIGLRNMVHVPASEADGTVRAGTISGFAYNDVAGEPIAAGVVPEPSGLALLALGAGAAALRRGNRRA